MHVTPMAHFAPLFQGAVTWHAGGTATHVASPPPAVDSAMVGRWCGSARINNDWVQQRTVEVDIDIAANGAVQGMVGDAQLLDARLRSNRNAIERRLHVKTDWIIDGQLTGDIIASENVRRTSVKIPLNWVASDSGQTFRGGVNTSGLPVGGAGSGGLAASRLVLHRCGSRAPEPG